MSRGSGMVKHLKRKGHLQRHGSPCRFVPSLRCEMVGMQIAFYIYLIASFCKGQKRDSSARSFAREIFEIAATLINVAPHFCSTCERPAGRIFGICMRVSAQPDITNTGIICQNAFKIVRYLVFHPPSRDTMPQ